MMQNNPNTRCSTDQLKFIMWMLKRLGVQAVPSLSTYHKFVDEMRSLAMIETTKKVSPLGNVFYQNPVKHLIAMVFLLLISQQPVTPLINTNYSGLGQPRDTPVH